VISDALNRVFIRAQLAAKREEGQAMVEYALIIALVAIALVTVLGVTLEGKISSTFSTIANNL
jgi:Flp pilus assembly pilin Flp